VNNRYSINWTILFTGAWLWLGILDPMR